MPRKAYEGLTFLCTVLLSVSAVTISLILVQRAGAARAEARTAGTEQALPALAAGMEAGGDATGEDGSPAETAHPLPPPHITPPATTGDPASGTDIILETVAPSSGSDLSAP